MNFMKHSIPIIIITLLLCACAAHEHKHQNKRIVIDIEELEPPKNVLPTATYDALLEQTLAEQDMDDFRIVAHNRIASPLVYGAEHPFFNGMYMAYAQHRPFVLSPDALWLVICQGFAQHVDHNAETLRHLFVDFEGKRTLTVYNDVISLDNPDTRQWEKVFPEFTKQIAGYTGDSLINMLTADFTTTTTVSRAASQLTIMAALQEYFDFELIAVCGIPQVILEGTPEDWQSIVDRVEWLRRYQLDWWVDEMVPVLRKIVLAAQGEVDRDFWRGMFKIHELPGADCGDPSSLADGWIVKFFPYNDLNFREDYWKDEPPETFRNNLQSLYDVASNLPPEITVVPLQFISVNDTTMLQLCAGFVGLTQDDKTYALCPQIGWFIIRKK